jgi:hypothetical protein
MRGGAGSRRSLRTTLPSRRRHAARETATGRSIAPIVCLRAPCHGTDGIEVTSVNSTTPEFYHIAGIVRFKVTGMILRTSNIPKPHELRTRPSARRGSLRGADQILSNY